MKGSDYISVVKSRRTDKSEMCYLANEVEYKVIKMTMNEKYFPKRSRLVIANKLIDSAMNVSANFNAANAIFPNTEEKLKLRERRKLKKLKIKLDNGEIEFNDVRTSYNSWRGLLKDKKCYKTKQSMDKLFNQLFIEDWRYSYEQA